MDDVSEQDVAPEAVAEAALSPLARWRKSQNLLQEEAGALVGVSKVSWGNWENYRKPPKGENLRKLNALTGLSTDDILGLSPAVPQQPRGGHLTGEVQQASPVPLRRHAG